MNESQHQKQEDKEMKIEKRNGMKQYVAAAVLQWFVREDYRKLKNRARVNPLIR